MGWAWEKYPTDVRGRLDEHGGDKEKRDAVLWKAFIADCDEAIQHIAKDPRYEDLDLYIDWAEVIGEEDY